MRRATLGLVTAAGLLVAGCSPVPEGAIAAAQVRCPEGSDCFDPVLPVGDGGEVSMDMGDFFFDNIEGAPATGEVVVTVTNVSGQYHNAVFLGAADGSEIPEANGGETGEATVLLFPGEWTVICDVAGHRAAGMETTVTVYATEEDAEAALDELGDAPPEGADPTEPTDEPAIPDADGGDTDPAVDEDDDTDA